MPSRPVSARLHPQQIPHLEGEDKVITVGPLELTFRQAAILFAGGWIALSVWNACRELAFLGTFGLIIRLMLVILPSVMALAFAFGTIQGRRYEVWLGLIWRSLHQTKIFVWRPLPPVLSTHQERSALSTLPEREHAS